MNNGPRLMRAWIAAPDPPDAAATADLCQQLRALPRISEAWLVGSRVSVNDGSPPRESTDIALVLDPALPDDANDARAEMSSFWTELDERVRWAQPGKGWLLVSAALIRAHEPQAVKIYARAQPSD